MWFPSKNKRQFVSLVKRKKIEHIECARSDSNSCAKPNGDSEKLFEISIFFVVVAVEYKPFRLFSIVVGEQQRGGERFLLIDRRLLDVLNWTGEHPGPERTEDVTKF